ncbi:MAG TPA: addiction module protein [Longimicrobiales bacterium]|jgi:putative addiction module component (TIGR02574 family)|nr:addiction module protein [Longimicrobiales bacterium]
MTVDQLKQEVLKLSPAERARLVEWIAAGIDVEAELESAWLAEARRRDDEIESGAVASRALDEALASVRARFGW